MSWNSWKPNYVYIDFANEKAVNKAQRKLEECTKEINNNPKNADLYVERARVYESLMKHESAVDDLTTAINLNTPKVYFHYYLRSCQYLYLDDFESAFNDRVECVKLSPIDCTLYYSSLAKMYEKMGQRENAIDILMQQIKVCPNQKKPYVQMSSFYEYIEVYYKAIEFINMAIEKFENSTDLLHRRIRIYTKIKQFERALKDCDECIKYEPNKWTHLRIRSEVYKAMGDKDRASNDYILSLDLNPFINR